MHSRFSCLLGFALLLIVAPGAGAQTLSWNTLGTGTFGVASNWTPATVPSLTGHTALFGLGGSYTVNFGASHSFGTLVTSSPPPGNQFLRFNAPASAVINPNIFVRFGPTASFPSVTWTGGTLRTNLFNNIEVQTSVVVNSAAFETGRLILGTAGEAGGAYMTSGTLLTNIATQIGINGSLGGLDMASSVGTLTAVNVGVPGGDGIGSFSLRQGSNVTAIGSVNIGAQGSFTTNSRLSLANASRFTMSGGSALNIGGSTTGVIGGFFTRGGELLIDSGTFSMGNGPTQINPGGKLNVSIGTFATNGNLTNTGRAVVGFQGSFIAPPTQTTIVNSRPLDIVGGGSFPTTAAGLESTGTFTCGTLMVGSTAGSDGWAKLFGASTISTLTSIGDGGTGLAEISNLNTPSLVLGRQAAGRGTVHATGAVAGNFGAVVVGGLGHGVVDLSTGTLTSNTINLSGPTTIGQSGGSHGTLIVARGAGSFAPNAVYNAVGQNVFVGASGTGTLLLGERGTLQAGTLTVAPASGLGAGIVIMSGGTLNAGAIRINPLGVFAYNGGTVTSAIDNSGVVQLNAAVPIGFGTINNAATGRVFAAGGLFAGQGVINNAGNFGGTGTLAAGMTLNNTGTLSSADGEFVIEQGSTFTNAAGGLLRNAPASTLRIRAPFSNQGNVEVNAGGAVQIASGSLNIPPGRRLTLKGGLLVAGDGDELSIAAGGTVVGFGQIDATILNDGSATFNGPTQLLGLLENSGSINVRNATTIVFGPASNNGSITVQNGTIIFEQSFARGLVDRAGGGGIEGMGITSILPAGRLVADAVRQGTLELAGNSTDRALAAIRSAGGRTSVVRALAIAGTPGNYFGQLDLADSAMVIDFTGASPASSVRDQLASGYAGGAWTGNGIASSAAADTPNRALGFAVATDIFSSFPASFAGESVDATSLLIRYTTYGDANLDHAVNISDFALLAASFNQPSSWSRGDFNYDQVTNISDFALLASNFNLLVPVDVPRGTAVPEPGVFGSLAAFCAAMTRRRRM